MRLRELREERGWTQERVASCLNCTTSAYARYERGERSPNIDMLRELSKLYGRSVDFIICND